MPNHEVLTEPKYIPEDLWEDFPVPTQTEREVRSRRRSAILKRVGKFSAYVAAGVLSVGAIAGFAQAADESNKLRAAQAAEQNKRYTEAAEKKLAEWGLTGNIPLTAGPKLDTTEYTGLQRVNFLWEDSSDEKSHLSSFYVDRTRINVIKAEDPEAKSSLRVDQFIDLFHLGYDVSLQGKYAMPEYQSPEYPLRSFVSEVTFTLSSQDFQGFTDSLGGNPNPNISVSK